MNKKLPALQFYVGDWRKDPGVQALDYESRGIWFEMLCLMHESEERGKLLLNGKPMPVEALSQSLGLTVEKTQQVVKKLIAYGVCGYDETSKMIYNKRMVRDEEHRKDLSKWGKMGADKKKNMRNELAYQEAPTIATHQATPIDSADENTKPPLKPKGGSSVSSSTSTTVLKDNAPDEMIKNLLEVLEELELYRDDGVLLDSVPKLVPQWLDVFKGVDIIDEIKRAHLWELSSPRNRKRNRPRFLSNWLGNSEKYLRVSENTTRSRATSQASEPTEVTEVDAQEIAQMAEKERSDYGY